MNKHLIWGISIILAVSILCGTLIYINNNSWTLRFEMDNNTKEAIESIRWEEINTNQQRTYDPIDEWAEWDMEDWEKAPIHFYYTNNNSPDEYIGNYKLNGNFNISDKDNVGNCWSYNGSDEMWDWRLVNIEEMIELRRCQYSDVFGRVDE